jgi:hypothetical protein
MKNQNLKLKNQKSEAWTVPCSRLTIPTHHSPNQSLTKKKKKESAK